MIPTAKDIKPKERGESDFFSWNLYRWVRNKDNDSRIFQSTWNYVGGTPAGLKKGSIFIGNMTDNGWAHGNWLNRILSDAPSKRFAFPPTFNTAKWKDITEKFWKKYLEKGACSLSDYYHDYKEVSAKTRVCHYCGNKQTKRIKTVKQEHWVDCQ